MTTIHRVSSAFFICLLVVAGFNACTDSESIDLSWPLKLQEQREAQDNQDRAERERKAAESAPAPQEVAPIETAPEQAPEEAPAEPEKVTVYQVEVSDRNTVRLTCKDIEEAQCGYKLIDCDDNYEHRCVTNFKYQEVQVDKTN